MGTLGTSESLSGLITLDLTPKRLETDEYCNPSRARDRWSIEASHIRLAPQAMACLSRGMDVSWIRTVLFWERVFVHHRRLYIEAQADSGLYLCTSS